MDKGIPRCNLRATMYVYEVRKRRLFLGGRARVEVKLEIHKLEICNSKSKNSCMTKPKVLTFNLGLIINEFRLATL